METEYQSVDKSDDRSWIFFFRQLLVVSIVWGSFIVAGMGVGSPTVVVPQLNKEANSTDAVSSEMASWLASIGGYSGSMGVFLLIPIAHFFGRKPTLLIIILNKFLSCSLIYVSKNAMYVLISQAFIGLSYAAHMSICLLIISEYSSPKYRGLFLTLKSATFFWGIWIANAIGIFTHYKYIGLVGIGISVVSLAISFFIPESPYWLAFKGRYDECSVAHRWLKGTTEDAENELAVLIKSQKECLRSNHLKKSWSNYFRKYLAALKQPEVCKPLLLCCLINCSYQFSGKIVCAVYAIEMMNKITNNPSTAHTAVLILDGFSVLGMYLGSGMSRILKRRTLLLTSSIIGTIFLFAMSIYLYLVKLSLISENSYVTIVMLVGYSVAICCGPMIMSTSISAELLPMRYRSFCVLIYCVFCSLLLGIVMKVAPYVFNSIGFHGSYFGFGVCMTIILTLIFVFVPETKGKTLYEIAEIFKAKKPSETTQLKLLVRDTNDFDSSLEISLKK